MNRDISNWGWGQILELPDHLFGRRFYVGCGVSLGAPGITYDISTIPLPEKCVMHGVCVCTSAAYGDFAVVSFALGDQVPANEGEFHALEQLYPDVGQRVGTAWHKSIFRNCACVLPRGKVGIDASGRRLVVRYQTLLGTTSFVQVSLEVSSAPRSLPEWFG